MMTFEITWLTVWTLLTPCVFGLGAIVFPGDVYIEFIGDIYSDDACKVIEPQNVQNLAAVIWTLENLKDTQFLPGFNIGKVQYRFRIYLHVQLFSSLIFFTKRFR